MSYYANPFDLARNAHITFIGKGQRVLQSAYEWDMQDMLNEEINESRFADCVFIGEWQSLTLADVMAYFEAVLRTHEGIVEVKEKIRELWLEKGEKAGMIIWLDNLLDYIAKAVKKLAGLEKQEWKEKLHLEITSDGRIEFYCRPEEAYKLARVEWKNSEVLAAAVKLGALSTIHAFKDSEAA